MTIMSNVDESFEVLTDGSTYSGVAGLVAGADC